MNAMLRQAIEDNVAVALAEDIGSGDLTAALLAPSRTATGTIVCREPAVLAGRPWVDSVFRQLDKRVGMVWQHDDGDAMPEGAVICSLSGPARSLLSGERTALNFLQTLSGTATVTADYVKAVSHTGTRILDTRKTLPGLRLAQKYAVRCGGGHNHRTGLYDAILIKENHIASAGGIEAAVAAASAIDAGVMIEVEVESIEQMREALAARVTRLLLDNFTIEQCREAVAVNRAEGNPPADLEASGGLTLEQLAAVAETGVDFISVGALTKNVRAIDMSMRFF